MAGQTFTQRIQILLDGAGKATKDSKKLAGGMNNLAKSALKAGAAYFTAQGVIAGVRKATEAFAKQELAERKLRFAAGDATDELIRQAKALQSTTRFGDEAIIAQQAYVKSLGISTEQTKEIIEASVDLASAMGISLESAVMNTTKTLSGMQGELGEKLPAAFKELTAAQLKAGEGIEFIREQFKGTAEEEVETLTGSLDQMSNAIGDAFEAIGSTFAPMIITFAGAVKSLAEGLNSLINWQETYFGHLDQTGRILTKSEIATMDYTEAVKEMVQPQVIDEIARLAQEMHFVNETTNEGVDIIGLMGSNFEDYAEKVELLDEQTIKSLVSQKEFIDMLQISSEEGSKEAEMIQLLIERYKELTKSQQADNDIVSKTIELRKKQADAAMAVGLAEKNAGQAALNAAGVFISSEIKKIVAKYISEAFSKTGFFGGLAAVAAGGAFGSLVGQTIQSVGKMKFAAEGMNEIVTEPTLILAGEEGAEYVNIEPTQNEGAGRGGVNISFSGNVLSRDFIEDEAVPMIKEALRKGGDLGIS